MRYSGRLSLFVAATLALTLAAKAAWTRPAPPPDGELFNRRAEALLHDAGFRTGRVVRGFGTVLFGRRGGCTLMVADHVPQRTFSEPIERLGRSVGPVSYHWRGATSAAPPRLAPLVEYYAWRELRRLGFSPRRHPVLALAGSDGCRLAAMDWTPLATLPR